MDPRDDLDQIALAPVQAFMGTAVGYYDEAEPLARLLGRRKRYRSGVRFYSPQPTLTQFVPSQRTGFVATAAETLGRPQIAVEGSSAFSSIKRAQIFAAAFLATARFPY